MTTTNDEISALLAELGIDPEDTGGAGAQTAVTPLKYLLTLMNDPEQPAKRRDWAAAQALSYIHARPSTAVLKGGKKEAQAERARKIATGRLAPSAPPKLVSVKK
jgi:hypothetical protein